MKYLKHYYVLADDLTSFVYYTNVPPTGRTLPQIDSLSVVATVKDPMGIDVCFSYCPNESDISAYSAPGLFEISYEQWITEIQEHFLNNKNEKIHRVYRFAANNKRPLVEDWFFPTEFSLFNYKKEQADLAISAATDVDADLIAPSLKLEASIRGISTKDLAQKVIANFNFYIDYESKVSGARGKAVDEIATFTLDLTSLETIKQSFDNIDNYDFVSVFEALEI